MIERASDPDPPEKSPAMTTAPLALNQICERLPEVIAVGADVPTTPPTFTGAVPGSVSPCVWSPVTYCGITLAPFRPRHCGFGHLGRLEDANPLARKADPPRRGSS